jgi:hypothetical protein
LEKKLTTLSENDSNKRKEKESKEKETELSCSIFDFSDWWKLYDHSPYRDSEERCHQIWHGLSEGDKERAIEVVAAYARATPDKQYRKNPANYLLEKRFNEVLDVRKTDTRTSERATNTGTADSRAIKTAEQKIVWSVPEYIPSRLRTATQ